MEKKNKLEKWRVRKGLIRIPAGVEKLPEVASFNDVNYEIIEISEDLWKREVINNKNWGNIESPDTGVVFRVLCKNGTCFYSYLLNVFMGGIDGRFIQGSDGIGIDGYYIDVTDFTSSARTIVNELEILAAVCGLATPKLLSEEVRRDYEEDVSKRGKYAIKYIARVDCPELLKVLFAFGGIKNTVKSRERALETLKQYDATECLSVFDEYAQMAVNIAKQKKSTGI